MRTSTAESTAFKRRGAFAWVSELAPRERRAFGACVGGWALDAMDVQMYSFVIPALIATWGITRGQAGGIGAGGLLGLAGGGFLGGWGWGGFRGGCALYLGRFLVFPFMVFFSLCGDL